MSSYDQWKTASPYDDDPDYILVAEKFLKEYEDFPVVSPLMESIAIIKGLLEILDSEGITRQKKSINST